MADSRDLRAGWPAYRTDLPGQPNLLDKKQVTASMQFPVDAHLRPAFFADDRYVVGHPTGKVQILPHQDLADYQHDGWQILILCQHCGLLARPISAFAGDSPMVQPSPPDNPVRTFWVCPPRSASEHECLILAELDAELTEQTATWTDDPKGS